MVRFCASLDLSIERRKLAESEGFEPSDPVTQIGSLANYWFQPLTHDSASGWL